MVLRNLATGGSIRRATHGNGGDWTSPPPVPINDPEAVCGCSRQADGIKSPSDSQVKPLAVRPMDPV